MWHTLLKALLDIVQLLPQVVLIVYHHLHLLYQITGFAYVLILSLITWIRAYLLYFLNRFYWLRTVRYFFFIALADDRHFLLDSGWDNFMLNTIHNICLSLLRILNCEGLGLIDFRFKNYFFIKFYWFLCFSSTFRSYHSIRLHLWNLWFDRLLCFDLFCLVFMVRRAVRYLFNWIFY